MACVSPDGKPIPLFRVRSGLRELVDAGFVSLDNDTYVITEAGSRFLSE